MSVPLLHRVHRAERAALLVEGGLTAVQPYVALSDLEDLRATPSVLRSRHPVTVRPLTARTARRAMVQHCPSLGSTFLWCHVDNDRYRAHYLRFLQQHHGWTGTSIPRSWHVDHVFNRARARRLQLPWIRMMLLPAPVNTSHGAGYEKGRTGNGIGRVGRQRKVDEVTLMKICGRFSPKKHAPLPQSFASYAAFIERRHHLPAGSVEQNVRDLMRLT